MSRTCVVTGSASGIGAATATLLRQHGHRVIGVDLRDAHVTADLSTEAGQARMVDAVRELSGGVVDAVVACAGIGGGQNPPERVVPINFGGTIGTLEGLRPLLVLADEPRAVAVASIALLSGMDDIVELCLSGQLDAAIAACRGDGRTAYAATKRAVASWAISTAVTTDWAAAGIALNVVAPGMVRSPLSDYYLGTPEQRAEVLRDSPQPLKGIGDPDDIAQLLCWLVAAENRFVTGQIIFADGGYQAVASGMALPRSHGTGRF